MGVVGFRAHRTSSGRCQGLARCFLRPCMFINQFVAGGRKVRLRPRNLQCFSWFTFSWFTGVQIPVMRDTLPSGKAEFQSGYNWSWGIFRIHNLWIDWKRASLFMIFLFMNWSPINLLGKTTGNG